MLKYKDSAGELFSNLSEENFLLFAVRNYCNPVCSGVDEFYEDVNKIKYIKRQITRYYLNDELNERLFLNNVITFFNVFEIEAAKVMLFYKLNKKYWGILKTTMVWLGYIKPDEFPEIVEDARVKEALQKL